MAQIKPTSNHVSNIFMERNLQMNFQTPTSMSFAIPSILLDHVKDRP